MAQQRKIKIVVAKPGLDGHDRGAKLLERIFAEAGMEVVYTGLRQTPEMITETALQEDADVVGLSGGPGPIGRRRFSPGLCAGAACRRAGSSAMPRPAPR